MQRLVLSSLAKITLCALLALGFVTQIRAEDKVNAVGNWTWEGQARGGGNPPTITLKLKMDGDKLVGAISRPGGRGRANANADAGATPPAPRVQETKCEDVKLVGDKLTFSVTNPGRGGNAGVTVKYSGTIKGDMIEGKMEREGSDPVDWKAKRATEKKEAAADAK